MPSMALCSDDSEYCFKALCRPAQASHLPRHDTGGVVCLILPEVSSFNSLRVWTDRLECRMERPITLAGLK